MACRVVVAILLLLLASCRDNKPVQSPVLQTEQVPADSSLIFNGTSLSGWEKTSFGTEGPISVSGGELILGMGEGCTGVTYKGVIPDCNYKITLDARRREGNDFFCGLTFPVKSEFCTFIAGGWGGAAVGLSNINGKDAAENETTSLRNFEKNKWYHIGIEVTETEIKAWINEEKVIDFKYAGKKLSVRPEVSLSKPFGIATWYTTAGIKNVRVERI
jgi:hypothetical protein